MTTPPRHLAVIGATGGTGIHLVQAALAAGHTVTALARDPARLPITHPHLHTVPGDVLDPTSLKAAAAGADAVLSALGSASPRQPTTLYSTGITNILAAMNAVGVARVVAISALPVTPRDQVGALNRRVVFPLLYRFVAGGFYTDAARMEALLHGSGTAWTVMRPPRLTNRRATGRYRTAVNKQLPRAGSISRADLAHAMLHALDDLGTIRATVITAY